MLSHAVRVAGRTSRPIVGRLCTSRISGAISLHSDDYERVSDGNSEDTFRSSVFSTGTSHYDSQPYSRPYLVRWYCSAGRTSCDTQPYKNRWQLQQHAGFHCTTRKEILPYVILGAGVTYFFAKTILDYRARKEAGLTNQEEDEDEDEDWDEEIDGLRPASKRKKKTLNLSGVSGVAGLDLGSMHSRIGIAVPIQSDSASDDDDYFSDEDEGTPKAWTVRIVENAEGHRSTASLIGLQQGEDEFVVGDKAKNLLGSNFWAPHYLLGLKSSDSYAVDFINHFDCEDRILSGIGGTLQIQVGGAPEDGGRGSPEMLTAQSIAHLQGVASQHVEGENNECSHLLLAVAEQQWQSERAVAAYENALKQAGVESLGVERQALCALHGIDREHSRSDPDWWKEGHFVAICDVGRSVETSLIRLGKPDTREAEVIAVETGKPFVGGQSLDEVITDKLLQDFSKENNGMDLRSDQMTFDRVADAINVAKHELSTKLTAEINLPYIFADATGPKHLIATLKRSTFERDTDEVMCEILKPCDTLLESFAGEPESSLTLAIVGGCARADELKKKVQKTIEKAAEGKFEGPIQVVSLEMPEEAVVNGAAVVAARRAWWQ